MPSFQIKALVVAPFVNGSSLLILSPFFFLFFSLFFLRDCQSFPMRDTKFFPGLFWLLSAHLRLFEILRGVPLLILSYLKI